MKSNAVDHPFPNHEAAIADLRRVDAVFDEICRDYQLLIDEYRSLKTEPGSQSYQFACDVRESLDGLWEEITRSLRRAGKT